MSLCIAVGAKSVSSCHLNVTQAASFHEDFHGDDDTTVGSTVLHAVAAKTPEPLLAMAQSVDQELRAIVTVVYFDMRQSRDHPESKAYSVAQVSIQILPSTEHLRSPSSSYRTTVYAIRLPEAVKRKRNHGKDALLSESRSLSLSVVFSRDRKSLSCLIPYHSDDPPASDQEWACSTVLIVFQLRKPRVPDKSSSANASLPPLPSYILAASGADGTPPGPSSAATLRSSHSSGMVDLAFRKRSDVVIPIATNPRIVSEPSLCFSAIQDIASTCPDFFLTTGSSLLLAGCTDGTLVAISYRPLIIAGVLYRSAENSIDEGMDENDDALQQQQQQQHEASPLPSQSLPRISNWIVEMEHMTAMTKTSKSGEDGAHGKLAVIYKDGRVRIFSTHITTATEYLYEARNNSSVTDFSATSFDYSESSDAGAGHSYRRDSNLERFPGSTDNSNMKLLMAVTENADLVITGGPFCVAEWISGNYLALMKEQQDQKNDKICPRVIVQVWGLSERGAAPLATWDLDSTRLEDQALSKFSLERLASAGDETQRQILCQKSGALQYDAFSDCLAISGVLQEEGELISPEEFSLPFVCIWSWRSNVEGLLLGPASPLVGPAPVSKLWFCKDVLNHRKLVHTMAVALRSSDTDCITGLSVSLEIYDTATLSISPHRPIEKIRVLPSNNLLVSSTSVAFPAVVSCSSSKDYEVEWMEARIPSDYLSLQGAPCLAAIGPTQGASIAIASERGLCALECPCDALEMPETSSFVKSKVKARRLGIRAPTRWHRFGTPADEASFSVIAMTWWEGNASFSSLCNDDILVAVIDVKEGNAANTRYLACWTQRWLDLEHQLVNPVSTTCWGLRISKLFRPSRISLLSEPLNTSGDTHNTQRKAVVLLSADDYVTKYQVFQLQVSSKQSDSAPYRDPLPYEVRARMAAANEIKSPAEVFLAGASFAFDLNETIDSVAKLAQIEYIATLGVLRTPGNGVDALAVSGSNVAAIGEVVKPASSLDECTISSYCQTDFVRGRFFGEGAAKMQVDCFVWLLQLSNGRLFCWSVPFVQSTNDWQKLLSASVLVDHLPSFVHSTCMILGDVAPAGNTSKWMQQPSMGVRRNVDLATVPASSFGCNLSSGQSCKKLHRSLCEQFEHELLRSDFLEHEIFCPSELSLSIPAFIPSFYALMLDTVKSYDNGIHINGDLSCACNHMRGRLQTTAFEDSSIMSLQLLILRVVELLRKVRDQETRCQHFRRFFTALVDVVRHHMTPLQFAALFLECGRAIEPDALRYLFPLPAPLGSNLPHGETVKNLYEISLEHGSVATAVASLPLFDDGNTMLSICSGIFHHCLDSFATSFEMELHASIYAGAEETETMRDIFRYALKLEDSMEESQTEDCVEDNTEEFTDEHDDDQVDSIASDESAQDQRLPTIFCGFGTRKANNTTATSTVNKVDLAKTNGALKPKNQVIAWANGNTNCSNGVRSGSKKIEVKSVAGVLSRHLLTSIFSSSGSLPHSNWKQTAVLANLLIGEGSSGLPKCPGPRFEALFKSLASEDFEALIPLDLQQFVGLIKFFEHLLLECEVEINSDQAEVLLDLVLILLDRRELHVDLEAETPGLIVTALVVSHICSRTSDIIGPESEGHLVHSAFCRAVSELP